MDTNYGKGRSYALFHDLFDLFEQRETTEQSGVKSRTFKVNLLNDNCDGRFNKI